MDFKTELTQIFTKHSVGYSNEGFGELNKITEANVLLTYDILKKIKKDDTLSLYKQCDDILKERLKKEKYDLLESIYTPSATTTEDTNVPIEETEKAANAMIGLLEGKELEYGEIMNKVEAMYPDDEEFSQACSRIAESIEEGFLSTLATALKDDLHNQDLLQSGRFFGLITLLKKVKDNLPSESLSQGGSSFSLMKKEPIPEVS
ncbi:MAG: hypothetical protein KTR28_08270 [Micavibrio sp.]|nr:hypothetical protein [Micavibrio sp.]